MPLISHYARTHHLKGQILDPDLHTDDDLKLRRWLRDARRGQQAAFAALYRRFLPLVHGILISRAPPAVADELTQECFASAFARLHQLREDHKFGAWIATMARRWPVSWHAELPIEAALDIASSGADPAISVAAAQVLRVLQTLPEAYRETLALRLIEGLSGPEIAVLTGLTPDSVRVNLHRGMDKLRGALALGAGPAMETVP